MCVGVRVCVCGVGSIVSTHVHSRPYIATMKAMNETLTNRLFTYVRTYVCMFIACCTDCLAHAQLVTSCACVTSYKKINNLMR